MSVVCSTAVRCSARFGAWGAAQWPPPAELARGVTDDSLSVSEARDAEVERSQPPELPLDLGPVLVHDGWAQAEHVCGGVGRQQDATVRGPQKAHLSGAMAGGVEHGQPAGDRQHLAVVQRVINRSWIDACQAAENRPDEEPPDQPVDYARRHVQRPETAARRDDRRIGRVAVHGRPCRRPDSGQATDVVRVGVSDDQMADIGRPPAGLRDPAEDVGVATGQPGIDQNTAVGGVDQEGIDNPDRDHEQAGHNFTEQQPSPPFRA